MYLLIIFTGALFVILTIVNHYYIGKITTPEIPPAEDLPCISVIIAARNEETNIEKLILSLTKINYPVDKYEVVIADDNSDDDTLAKLRSLTAELHNFKIVTAAGKELAGKRGALQKCIETAAYNNFAVTDADCRPQKKWLRSLAAAFNSGAEVVFGNAPIIKREKLVTKIAAYENFRSSMLTFASAAAGIPYSAAARNFGFTHNAYDTIGGYASTADTLSGDDDLFIREAVKNNLTVVPLLTENGAVPSEAEQSMHSHLRQKARHATTGVKYLLRHQLMLGLWHLLNIFMLFSVGLLFITPYFSFLLIMKLYADSVTALNYGKKFGYRFTIAESFYLPVLYELFLIVHFLRSLSFRGEWK